MPMPRFPWRRARPFAAALLGYAAAWAVMTYPQVLSWRFVGDLGDPLGKMWQMGWVAHALVYEPTHLFDGNVFFPAGWALAYSDTMLVPSLMAAPLLWLGLPLPFVYNVFVAGGFVGSGVAMFLLVRRLTAHTGAAWVAGLAFAFLPFRFNHYPHLELHQTAWMPLTLWALHRAVDRGRWRDGLLVGASLGAQLLSSLYYGVFLSLILIPLSLVLLTAASRPLRTFRALAAGVVLAGFLAAPVVAVHLAARQQVGERDRSQVLGYSATFSDYLRPNADNRMYRSLANWHGEGERRLFPGFALIVLAGIGLWPVTSRVRMAYALSGLVALDASRGLRGVVYEWLWETVPALAGFRVPARFGMLTGLMLAVLAGWGVTRLARYAKPRWAGVALVATLSMAVLAESWSAPLDLEPVWRRVPAVYAWLSGREDVRAVELPIDEPSDFMYMYYATSHWRPIMNGQSGFFPRWYGELVRLSAEFPSDESVRFLRDHGATHVIVHRRLLEYDRFEALAARVVGRRDVVEERAFPPGTPESIVYRLRP